MSRSFFAAAFAMAVVGCGSDGGGSTSPPRDAAPPDSADASVDVAAQPDAADDGPPDLTCSAYCAIVGKNCVGANQAYVTPAACARACADLAQGNYDDTYDTMGCREAHAVRAASAPATECDTAGAFGGGVCGDRCSDFCILLYDFCADHGGFQGTLDCETACASWPFAADAGATVTTGNTLACREHYLGSAFDPSTGATATACANAGKSSTTCR